jgi:hypothetical protein
MWEKSRHGDSNRGHNMIDRPTQPSDRAISLARAFHAVPSVQPVCWTDDQAGGHVWGRIQCWPHVDFAPSLHAHDQADPDLTVDLRVFSAEDHTEDTPRRVLHGRRLSSSIP